MEISIFEAYFKIAHEPNYYKRNSITPQVMTIHDKGTYQERVKE